MGGTKDPGGGEKGGGERGSSVDNGGDGKLISVVGGRFKDGNEREGRLEITGGAILMLVGGGFKDGNEREGRLEINGGAMLMLGGGFRPVGKLAVGNKVLGRFGSILVIAGGFISESPDMLGKIDGKIDGSDAGSKLAIGGTAEFTSGSPEMLDGNGSRLAIGGTAVLISGGPDILGKIDGSDAGNGGTAVLISGGPDILDGNGSKLAIGGTAVLISGSPDMLGKIDGSDVGSKLAIGNELVYHSVEALGGVGSMLDGNGSKLAIWRNGVGIDR